MMRKWLMAITISIIYVFDKGEGADLELRCLPFTDGEVSTLTAKVNKTAVDSAQCTLPAKQVTFSRKRVSDHPKAPVLTMCQTPYPCSDPRPVPTPASGEELCGCVKTEGDILTFELKFNADKKLDTAANYSFQLCAAPKVPLTEDYDKSCSSVFVGQLTTTTGTSTANGSDSGCGDVCVWGPILEILLLLVLVM